VINIEWVAQAIDQVIPLTFTLACTPVSVPVFMPERVPDWEGESFPSGILMRDLELQPPVLALARAQEEIHGVPVV
jgi:hypothetical protein